MTTYRPYASSARWSWLPAVTIVGVFLIVPLAVIVSGSLTSRGFVDVITSASMRGVWWFTFWQAVASAVATFVVALPATWLVSRYAFPGRRLLIAVMTIPFLLPTVVVGAAFLALLPRSMHYTSAAIIMAHAYFNVAVVVRIVGARWQQINPQLGDAARTLGASPTVAARTITWPMLRGAVISASGVIFLFCFTSYGVIRILGGPAVSTVETEIYVRAVIFGDLDGAVALGILQMVVLLTLLGVWGMRRGDSHAVAPTIHLRRATTRRTRWMIRFVVTVMVVATCAPMIAVALRSVRVRGRFSGAGWASLASNGTTTTVTTSLAYAFVAGMITIVIALGAATAVTYGPKRLGFVSTLTSLPLTVSAVTVGLGILITFDSPPFEFRSAWFITPIAHSLVAVPLALRTVLPVAREIPPTLAHAAATLGARPVVSWLTVDWPLLSRAAASAGALAFAVSIGEFGATSFLTRRASETMPIQISRLLGKPGDLNQLTGYMLATLLIIVCIAVVGIVDRDRVVRR
jgi:thiamine transport system permease protein